jgi:LysM repeat protein
VSIPGLRGAETATPSSTPGCEPRKDWKLRYTVQFNDALAKIADKYSTTVDQLAAANCLTDVNLIRVGQELRVPGDVQPVQPYVCTPWEVLTPLDGTLAIEGEGQLTFNWHGPRAAHNLIRIIRPDNSKKEFVVDLRENETITLIDNLPAAGTYTWYVYPLDANYVQIPCHEGGPWTFTKAVSPTITPTVDIP